MFIPVSIRWDRCLWKTLIPVKDMQLYWTAICGKRSFHRGRIVQRLWKMFIPPGRCYCGKRSFHWDKTVGDVIVENAYSTETKLLAIFLWETLILLIINRKVFVENAHSTERHVTKSMMISLLILMTVANRTYRWMSYGLCMKTYRKFHIWRTFVWHCVNNIFDMPDNLTFVINLLFYLLQCLRCVMYILLNGVKI